MTSNKVNELRAELLEKLILYQRGTRIWGFSYHFFLYGAIACSAAATILLKQSEHTDVAALLTFLATLFMTLIAGGGFNRRWRAFRQSRAALEELSAELTDQPGEVDRIRDKFTETVSRHNQLILGPE